MGRPATQRVSSGGGLLPTPFLPWALWSQSHPFESLFHLLLSQPTWSTSLCLMWLVPVSLLYHLTFKSSSFSVAFSFPEPLSGPKPQSFFFHLVPLDLPWRSAQKASKWKVCPSPTHLFQRLCSISITSLKLETACNVMVEKSNETLWNHFPVFW